MQQTGSKQGHIYVLVSPKCDFVKVGGTDHQPLRRIREINSTEPYKSFGPWTLHDFRQVTDWRKIEAMLHYILRDSLVTSIPGQKELFSVSPLQASRRLEEIDDKLITNRPTVDRMFQDESLVRFLEKLFRTTGLFGRLELQGAWTLTLFPSTNGGRYYTINIGPHEVAFASTPVGDRNPVQMIHADRLIRDLPDVSNWMKTRNGTLMDKGYKRSLGRSTSAFFEGTFDDALEFLQLKGVRRAIVAYWSDALIQLEERGLLSVFARHHNWNAVAALKERMGADHL